MGSCCFANGLFYRQASFNILMTSMIASLILVALCFLAIPSFLGSKNIFGSSDSGYRLSLSLTIAALLLFFYIVYLWFELRSHSPLFEEFEDDEVDVDQEAAELILSPVSATSWLVVSLTCLIICAWNTTSDLNRISFGGSGMFIGFILFPFLGNVTDFTQACLVATRNRMDIIILVTLGSGMQILLFTLPVLMILGRIIRQPMTLEIGMFELVVTFISLFTVNQTIRSGISDYLLGATYISLCVVPSELEIS